MSKNAKVFDEMLPSVVKYFESYFEDLYFLLSFVFVSLIKWVTVSPDFVHIGNFLF